MSDVHSGPRFTHRVLSVSCPRCDAEVGQPCHTLTTGLPTTRMHNARWEAYASATPVGKGDAMRAFEAFVATWEVKGP